MPGNPATVSWAPQDVGQWLCVPPFRVVCLFQATLTGVADDGVLVLMHAGPALGGPAQQPMARRCGRAVGVSPRRGDNRVHGATSECSGGSSWSGGE